MAKSYSRYVLRRNETDASVGRPYWCGKWKCWTPGLAFATIYKNSHRQDMERRGDVPPGGAWEMIGVSEEDFVSRFKTRLMERITKKRTWASYGLDEVDERVRAIVADLKQGRAEIRDVAKEVALELGIPATRDAIQVFLNTPASSLPEDHRLSA